MAKVGAVNITVPEFEARLEWNLLILGTMAVLAWAYKTYVKKG